MLNFVGECSAINLIAVRGFGEAEFWLSGGKVILIFLLFGFTFVTMVGGNPAGDAYGFRHWNNPGAFREHLSSGALGRFEGFLACLWNASFAVVGPEYISMVAAEAKRPRIYIKTAFKTIYYRFALFFFGSALCVGIVLAYNDRFLSVLHGTASEEVMNEENVEGNASSTAAASPYVIAMENMSIQVLPHIVNALMMTSIYSAGNTYTFCATRTLYGLALEGRAPRFLRKTWSNGVPIYCFCVVMVFPMLSFLQVGEKSSDVIGWFVSLITAGGIIDFIVMSVTFISFYNACKAQGLDRKTLPYYGRFQPYGAYFALFVQVLIVGAYGYTVFDPWSVESFFRNYTMQLLAPVLFFGWKLYKKTKWLKPLEVDLKWEAPLIDAYEARFTEPAPGFWTEMIRLVGIKRKSKPASDV